MWKIGDTVVYGTSGICQIAGREKKRFGDTEREYLLLTPRSSKNSTVIFLPADNEALLANIHAVLSARELSELIPTLTPFPPEEWGTDARARSKKYKAVLSSGDRLSLMRLVRTVFGNKARTPTASEEDAAHRAAAMLYEELSLSLSLCESEVVPLLLGELPPIPKE